MKLNCKPGDLAIIVGGLLRVRGLIIEVVRLAPICRFQLPDGRWHVAGEHGDWVIKLPRVIPCPTKQGNVMGNWAVISDKNLRPVTGLPVDEETLVEVTL